MKTSSKWRQSQNKNDLKIKKTSNDLKMKTTSKWRLPQNEDNLKKKKEKIKWLPQNEDKLKKKKHNIKQFFIMLPKQTFQIIPTKPNFPNQNEAIFAEH